MAYTKETSDLPQFVRIAPSYDSAGAVSAVSAQFSWLRRLKNDADATDIVTQENTAVKTVDLWVTNKSVTHPVLGSVTYRQISQLLKLVADAER